jgi:hypothetical protein
MANDPENKAVSELPEEEELRRKRARVLEMFGQLDWHSGYEYKSERALRDTGKR